MIYTFNSVRIYTFLITSHFDLENLSTFANDGDFLKFINQTCLLFVKRIRFFLRKAGNQLIRHQAINTINWNRFDVVIGF